MMNNYNSLNYRKDSKFSSQEPEVVGNAPNSSGSMRTSWLMSLLFIVVFMFNFNAWSQVANYSFTQSTGTFTTLTGAISGGGAILATPTGNTISTSQDDAIYTVTGFPFTFTFNGVGYTGCSVSTNGFITFGGTAPASSYYTPISGTTAYNGAISPWGKDSNSFFNLGGRTGEIRWDVVGTAPNREIVIQWKDWHAAYLSSSTTSYGFSYQVRLQENGNKVVIAYGPGSFAIGSTAVSGSTTTGPQVGLRGASNADFNIRTNASTVLFTSSTASATNTTSTTQAFNTSTSPPGMPSNGLIYTFAPPTPCSGTPTAGTVTPATQALCTAVVPANLVVAGYTTGVTGITFQWQQSSDNTNWGNVVGGTGATTTTYTPVAFAGTTIYYRCRVTCTSSGLTADTPSVVVTPPANPSTQATAAATSSITGSGMTASWTNGNGARRVVYINNSPSFTDPVNGNAAALVANTVYSGSGQQIVLDGTASTVSVTGLSLGTTYYFKVYEYARCGAGPYDYYYNTTTGTNTASGTTCSAVSVPYSESFETAVVPNFAACTVSSSHPLTRSTTTTGAGPRTGTLYQNIRWTPTVTKYLYSAPLAFTGSTSYDMGAWYMTDGIAGWTSIKLYANTSASVTGATLLTTVLGATNTTYQKLQGTYIAPTTGTYYFIIEVVHTSGPNDMSIDDLFAVATPTCISPSTLASSSVTTTNATISWAASSTPPANGYDYYVSTVNTAPIATTTPTGNVPTATLSASLTGLTPSTTYYYWVRSNCTVSDQSAWAGSGTFTTLTPGQLGAGLGTSSNLPIYSCYGYNYSQQIYLASELNSVLTPGSTYITKIRFKPTTVASLTQTTFNGWTVYLGNTTKSSFASTTDWVPSTSMSQVYSSTLTTMADGVWVELTLATPFQWDGTSNLVVGVDENTSSFSCTAAWASYPAGAVRGILYYNDTTNPDPTAPPTAVSTYSDIPQMQVVAIPTPTCFFPTSLTATAVTNNSATIGWTAPGSGTPASYDYYISTSSTAPTGSTTPTGSVTAPTTSVVASGLSANTNYYYWVRTYCSVSDQSGWAGAGTFTTPCNPASLPYNEGFEGIVLAGDTPSCMSASPAITAGGKIRTYIAAATGTNAALTPRTGSKFGSVYYSPNAKGTFISPPIALTAGVSYTASAYYITDGVAWPTVGIYYGTTATEAGMTNTIATVSSAAATTYTKISGTFTPATTGIYYIGFQADNTTTNAPNYCSFDDLSVVLTPTAISSFSPAAVCSQAASTVTINGVSFTGATAVKFNGVDASSYTVVNDSQITAVAPLGVTGGYITVNGVNNTGTSATTLAVTNNPTLSAITITSGATPTCLNLDDASDNIQLNNTYPGGTWSSSDISIATVDGSGLVTPLTEGTVTITYSASSGSSPICSSSVTKVITINKPVVISSSTLVQTVVTGNNAVFSVTATGTGMTYQWYESAYDVDTDTYGPFVAITNGGVYSGATSSSLTINATPSNLNGYQYMCTVTGTSPCASVDSNPATLNVGNTGITGDPADQSLCDTGSGTATFTVVPSGTVDSYVWYENQGLGFNAITDGTVGGVTYDTTTTPGTLTLTGLTLANTGWTYKVDVVGPANTATSNPALLTINQSANFASSPSNQTVCYTGGSATFGATLTGNYTGVQWQYSTDNSSWNNVANGIPVGATYTGATYTGNAYTGSLGVTTTASTPVSGTYYYKAVAIATAPCSNASSASAQLIINNPTTSSPVATTVVAGNSATFSVVATATSPTYQWQYATALAGPYTNVADATPATVTYTGATSATLSVLTTNGTAASTTNYYRCVVTSNGTCSVTSTGAQLTITAYCQPATTSGGASDSITNAVITNVTQATNITQASSAAAPWYTFYNNTPLNITQGENMSVAMTFGTDGTQYSAVWIDYNRDGVFSATENVALATSAAGGSATVTYNFTIPFTATPGVTRIRLRGASDGAYTAAGACTATAWGETEDYLLNIIVAPACSGAPVAGTATSSVANVCYTGTANLAVTGYSTGVTGVSLQWYNSAGAISGATSSTYTTPVLSATETYFCRVTCANGGAYSDTNILTIGVDAPSVTGTTPNTRCGTGSVALNATGSAGTTLGWYAAATGGVPLGSGTTFNTPSIAATTTYYVQANIGGSTSSVGAVSPSVGTYGTSFTGSYEIFNATNQVTLNSVDVYPTAAGTVTVELMNSSGTVLQTSSTYTVTAAQANTTLTVVGTPVTIPVGFVIPVGTGYRLNFKTGSTATLVRNSAGAAATYGPSNGVTITGNSNATVGYYYNFYNWSLSTGCSSTRTAVTATVTAPPALTISSATSSVCNGLSTTTPVTITSNLGDYDTYTWSPATGVSGSAASGYTFNPTATTTYTLTGTSAAGCANTATHTVTVNALPSAFAVSPATTTVCSVGLPVMLAAAPSNPTPSPTACTEIGNGQYPSTAFTPTTCDGTTVNSITTLAYGGEYSVVNTSSNTIYTFGSSLAGDYVTIMDSTGTTVLAYGPSPLTWYNASQTSVRFISVNTTCTADSTSRTRSVICKPVNSVVFSPSTGLFTDAAGTTPYTGTAVTAVYAKPAATTTYTATATNASGCIRTATATVNVSIATAWYADLDGDGYGNLATLQMACSQPVGYVANSTDCNDSNSAIFQSALLYTDADNDGYDAGSAVTCYGATLPVGTKLTTLGPDCNDNNATMHATYTFYTDADADGYGDVAASAQVLCAASASTPPSSNLSQYNTDCDDTRSNVRPGAVDVCYDGLDNDCNGNIDNVGQPGGCTPVVGSLPSATCGSTITALNVTIAASNVTGATGYRFKVTRVDKTTNLPIAAPVILDRPVNNLALSNVAGTCYDSRYMIEVAVKYAGVWQPYYGPACFVNTPNPVSTIGAQCGTTLTAMNQSITTTSVPSVTAYTFRVTQMDATGTTAVGTPQTTTQGLNKFNMTQLTGILYGTWYKVEVSLRNVDGVFLSYNAGCNIKTPAYPTTQVREAQCNNYQAISNTESIIADAVSTANMYRFRLTSSSQPYDFTYDTTFNKFSLNKFPGLIPGETYTVEVSIRINGQADFGPYGKACTVITPPAARSFSGTTVLEVANVFEAMAVPNPFADNFKLDVKTNSEEVIQVKVYDMLGKLVESRAVTAVDVQTLEVGANYPSGVYNVIVSQGENTKTLRVIKR